MFPDPEKTALVVLGASAFPNIPKMDREVFLSAKESIVKYFCDPLKGLGLRDSHIFDRFNVENNKNSIILEMNDFLRDKSPDDVFIYICSHGHHRGGYLQICLRTSEVDDIDTYLDFEDFIENLEGEAKCRIYCIIDCCCSGAIHEHSPQKTPQTPPEETSYRPTKGITILTSNNRETKGTVTADDSLPGINTPLFTHILLQILNEGAETLPGYGIAFEHICQCIRERIPELIRDLKLTSEKQDKTHIPDFSDRPRNDGRSGRKLSQVCVFQNNSFSNIRHVREIYHKLSLQQLRFIANQNKLIDKQSDEIESLKSANSIMQKDSHLTTETFREELATLQEMNAMYAESKIHMKEKLYRIDTLESTNLQLDNKNQNLINFMEKLEVENKDLKSRIDSFSRENGDLKDDLSAMNSQLEESELKFSRLVRNVARNRRYIILLLVLGAILGAFALSK